MTDNEITWDKLLQIQTCGLDDTNTDEHRYRYEPTPYEVLERLAQSGHIGKDDTLLDYGCGKGRVCFFLSFRTRAKTIGIEYDEHIYHAALENRKTAAVRGKADFVRTAAEEYEVPAEVSRCFFFNPFSVEILSKVMARIIGSWYEHPREILLFFYYPFEDYVAWLMAADQLEFCGEIDCGDGLQQRVMVFRLPQLRSFGGYINGGLRFEEQGGAHYGHQ